MNAPTSSARRRFRPVRLCGRLLLLVACALEPLAHVAAQTAPEPQREELLNGLRVLFWQRPSDQQVFIKLRVHSGAAFDTAGKEGLMALLGDSLFPDPSTREDVIEELGGRLDVATGFDSIDVTITGRAANFERLLELLRNAILTPQLSAEVVARLRDARIKAVREISIAPSTMADRAIATRLFGAFPYGRTVAGLPESLARIDRADLLLARERFFNPNNATLVVIGGLETVRVRRVLRQFLGAWRKSDRDVPATFRLADAPDARTLLVNLAGMPDAEVRLAVRGLARSDRDSAAARVVAVMARERWLKSLPELKGRPFFVTHQAYALPGDFRLGASVPTTLAAQTLERGRAVIQSFASAPPTTAELDFARKEVVATLNAATDPTQATADEWLNVQTYQTSIADEIRAIDALTPADVQRVAVRLFRDVRVAAVAVGDVAQLQASMGRAGEFEVLGATVVPVSAPRPAAAAAPPAASPTTAPTTTKTTTTSPPNTDTATPKRP
jgi:predicted Zn-dependent peptidase